ncbi:hypothetical protein [Vibrio aquimaris]|uniref:Uncharacterized protein n=1 Tax=Vibrio aquimaris TaxID=2587862 RepID=A0A5P9CJY4_9VIBR|nr:hypothetical protein [Vibrio aquimaris]QFT26554.1 hypothetical protein FIV01_08950 [Vibrio aquimaris]
MQKEPYYLHLDECYFDSNIMNELAVAFDSIHVDLLRGRGSVQVVDMQGWSRDKLKQFNRSITKNLGDTPYIIKNAVDNKQPKLRPYSWYTQEDCLKSSLAMKSKDVVLSNHNHLYHLVNHPAVSLIESTLSKMFPDIKLIENSGSFIYPPDDGMMSWHTNETASSAPVRIYFVYTPEDRKSFFRYVDAEGRIYTSWDRKGWNIRAFYCGNVQVDGFRLWHCVLSNTHRFSFGFRLTGIAMDQLSSMTKGFDSNYMSIEDWRVW